MNTATGHAEHAPDSLADTSAPSPPLWRRLRPATGHPLLIALVVAAFTAWFGPAVTREWQNHDRELALKDELVQQSTAASAKLVSAVQGHEFRPNAASTAKYEAAFAKWDEESQALGARISVYLTDPDIAVGWRTFAERTLDFYDLAGTNAGASLRRTIVARLAAYAGLDSSDESTLVSKHPNLAYQHAWRKLKYGLLRRRDEVQKLILTASVRL